MGLIQSIIEFSTEFFKLFSEVLNFSKAGDEIVKIAEIYDEMRNVVQNTEYSIYRFLIITAHNGGKDMKSYNPAYCSIVHEEIRAPVLQERGSYQRLPIDSEYISMLRKLYIEKEINLETSQMLPSILKTIYESEGIKHARVFFLKQDKKNLWFCSIGTIEDNNLRSPRTDIAIRLAVNRIKHIING